LIACSLFLAVGFLGAYIWAARHGQFDDDYTPSVRILFDDEEAIMPPSEEQPKKQPMTKKK
jgi:cbb3-type cytochrome oxidase maturation protein